jgi:DNA-directed RNA polymerase specialized sigma24 family protein
MRDSALTPEPKWLPQQLRSALCVMLMKSLSMFEPGDCASFEAFYARYYQYVVRTIMTLWVRSDASEELEDLAQDVFLDAWRSYAKLKDSPTCFGWLKLVATRAVCFRRRRFFRKLPTISMEDPRNREAFRISSEESERTLREVLPGPAVDYLDGLLTGELRALVGPEDLRLLSLRAAGYHESEIATLDQTSPAVIHKKIQRARNRVIGMLPAA